MTLNPQMVRSARRLRGISWERRPRDGKNGDADRSPPDKLVLIGGKAVQQPGAAGAYQTFLAAASGSMSGVP